jgi:Na+/melibiose symporter-like transporter
MVILAISIWIVVIPVTFLLRNPRAGIDIEPSDEKKESSEESQKITSDQTGGSDFTVKQALKSRIFWQITITSICHMALLSATVTHIMPYLTSVGNDREVSGIIASIAPVTSIGGRIGFGWLGDRVDKRKIAGFSFVLLSIGLLLWYCH